MSNSNGNRQAGNPFVSPNRDGLGLLAAGLGLATLASFFVVHAHLAAAPAEVAAPAAPARPPAVLAAPHWGLAIHGGPLTEVAARGPPSTGPAPGAHPKPLMVATTKQVVRAKARPAD